MFLYLLPSYNHRSIKFHMQPLPSISTTKCLFRKIPQRVFVNRTWTLSIANLWTFFESRNRIQRKTLYKIAVTKRPMTRNQRGVKWWQQGRCIPSSRQSWPSAFWSSVAPKPNGPSSLPKHPWSRLEASLPNPAIRDAKLHFGLIPKRIPNQYGAQQVCFW